MGSRKIAFTRIFFSGALITGLLYMVFTSSPLVRGSQRPQQPILNVRSGDGGNLPDRTIRIFDLKATPGRLPKLDQIAMTVLLTNIGKRGLTMQPNDFMLTAEGDIF
jgi:hypothetical protein